MFILQGALVTPFVLMIVVGALALASSLTIVKPYEKKAYTLLGQYKGLLGPGYTFITPFVSKTTTFDTRVRKIDVKRQEAITQDNSPVTADAVVYVKVMDAERAFLEVDDHIEATASLAQTTLRAVIGNMRLDETLKQRRQINSRIKKELAGPTDEWGINVESVEVREVSPSDDVQSAMEEQTSAERRRRAMILEAEGQRQSAIEEAEGEKKSEIIRAQGSKRSQVLEAQGEAISTVLRSRAAQSMGERAIIERGMETLEQIGEGASTKYIIPQELSSMLGRYGKSLSGSNVNTGNDSLDALDFDEETKTMLGLDNIDEVIGEIDKEIEEAVEEEVDVPNPQEVDVPETEDPTSVSEGS